MKGEPRLEAAWAERRKWIDAPAAEARAPLEAIRKEIAEVGVEARCGQRPQLLAQALHMEAHLALDLDRGDDALELWTESVSLLRDGDDLGELAHKVRHLGDALRRLGRPGEARERYVEALGLYRSLTSAHPLNVANAVRALADILEQTGSPLEAIPLWQEARELYASLSIEAGVEEADTRLAELRNPIPRITLKPGASHVRTHRKDRSEDG